MSAPPSTAAPSAASVPASRAAGGRPVSAPTKSLRDTATSSGPPNAASSGNRRSSSIDSDGLFARSMPGSKHQPLLPHAALAGDGGALAQQRDHVGHHVVIARGMP